MKMEYRKPQMEVSQIRGVLVMSDTSANLTIEEGTPDPEQGNGVKPW